MSLQPTTMMQDTAAEWTANNPFLPPNWIGLETDTGRMKIGTGSAQWASLPYYDNGVSREAVNLTRTITAPATTGAQTINKPSGTVNIAAAGSSVVVTNSLVTANSIVFAVIRTADATATFIKSVVPAAGSFTITLNANATAEISIGFLVTN